MEKRTLFVGSPPEPSGASWLLNCFLELDVMICHHRIVEDVFRMRGGATNASIMWREDGDAVVLDPRVDMLRKWLPALSTRERFRFRPGLQVEYSQDFATSAMLGRTALFFVRDPRDALWSMFHRSRPDLSFREFLRVPDRRTLLDRVENWCLQVTSWQQLEGARMFRFEDYKRDAGSVLAAVLQHVGVEADERAIERAVNESTFDKARAAETGYRARYPGDREVANRAGRVGDWRDHPEAMEGIEHIEKRAGAVMRRLGYEAPGPGDFDPMEEVPATVPLLRFFDDVLVPRTGRSCAKDDWLDQLQAFAESVDEEWLRRARLSPVEVRQLLASLEELITGRRGHGVSRLRELQSRFEEGSDQHFARIRELLAGRRARK